MFIGFGVIVVSAVCFLIVVELTKLKDKEKIECIVNSLRTNNNAHDEVFDSFGPYFGSEYDCNIEIKRNLDGVFDETQIRINNQIGQRQFTNCVLNRLKNNDVYKSLILMSQVLDYSKVSWKFWNYFNITNRLASAQQGLKLLEEFETISCVSNSSEIDESFSDDDEASGSEDISIQRRAVSDQIQPDDGLFFEL